MSIERINIAIAEACGWKFDDSMEMWLSPNDTHFFPWQLPDYCNDLNAVHEAEKFLKIGLRNTYDAELSIIAVREHCFIWETTARQRAEAFLRTIGKWEEAEK